MTDNLGMIKKQSITFRRARANLLLVIALTTVNLILAAFQSEFYILFSATIPTIIYGYSLLEGFAAIGLAIALVMVGVYLLCYLMSKKRRIFMLIALIFFAVDTLLFAYILYAAVTFEGFEIGYMIEVAFCGWIMFYLITGTIAWAKLRKVSDEEIEAVRLAVASEENKSEEKAAMDEISSEGEGDRE